MPPPHPTRAARRYARAYADGKRLGRQQGLCLGLLLGVLCLWGTIVVGDWLDLGEEQVEVVEVTVRLPPLTVGPPPHDVAVSLCEDCLEL